MKPFSSFSLKYFQYIMVNRYIQAKAKLTSASHQMQEDELC